VLFSLLQQCWWLAAAQVIAALLSLSPQQLHHTWQGRPMQLAYCMLLLLLHSLVLL
jgi:hypothetical protein